MFALDHLAITATTLDAGAKAVASALGVGLSPGGKHATMGTHNQLLSLGPGIYLEVIAVDPEAPAPGRPRWFDLDNFSGQTTLGAWVVRTENLKAALETAPPRTGRIHDLRRGDLRWRMAIPEDGRLPFDGVFPALIEWQGPHPSARLPESGCRLRRLTVRHPEAEALADTLSGMLDDSRVEFCFGSTPALRAEIDTPSGLKVLT